MKKQRVTILMFAIFMFAILMLIAGALQAQELMYGQREVQVSYNGLPSIPSLVFNGEDFIAFYHWAGSQDKNSGLHMRRISTDGKPFGPQRQIMPLEISDPVVAAVWDGSGYVVFASEYLRTTWHILRVDTNGNLLRYRKVKVVQNRQVFRRVFPFIIDDRLFFFFSTTEDLLSSGGQSYMITADSELKQKPVLTTLPAAGLQKPTTLGVALDPDKFLVFLGQYKLSFGDYEVQKAALLHVDFDGKVKKKVSPANFKLKDSRPAEQIDSSDTYESAGPLYTGDGYVLFATYRNFSVFPSNSYPYINNSVKIDDTGQIIDGPHNLGNGDFAVYLGKPYLLGRYIGMAIDDLVAFDTQMMLMGLRGRHITDLPVHEARFSIYFPVAVDVAYSGSSSVMINVGQKNPYGSFTNRAIFSNVIADSPKFKPSFVYFQGSNGTPLGGTKKIVMWNVAACTDVILTGPDFEMAGLPPLFHTVVDTNGERTVLRLTITGTDGSTKTKRLVLEP